MSTFALLALLLAADAPRLGQYFKISVVDEQSGRGVPLVELTTVNDIRYVSDSNGFVAFYEPELVNQSVFFSVKSHGYEFPKDGFGFSGRAVQVKPGGSVTFKLKRLNLAERLYRVTGGGIYGDSVLLGQMAPLRHPLLNAQVFGSDSVVNAVYNGKIYWFWGDTNRPSYPLGNFHVPGATSTLAAADGLDPEIGVDLDYFLGEDGFAKPTARMPREGPTWIDALVSLHDETGQERLFAAYVKVKGFLEIYQRGLVVFNPEKEQFEKVTEFDVNAPVFPQGHPFRHVEDGIEYVYFAHPYPLTRVRADPEHLKQLSRYEAYTCLKTGAPLHEMQVERAADGAVRYAWRKNTPPVGPAEQAELIKAGKLKPQEALLQLRDANTGRPVTAHRGSVYWNAYRKRWVMIAVESLGTSALGEIWFAEADTPLGPWVYAKKIVTHDNYSFYNPKQHPMFDKEGGRVIFFEGTYTNTFSGNPDRTPRYNYNQIMYKLDLAQPQLELPVAVYETPADEGPLLLGTFDPGKGELPRAVVAFFACDHPFDGSVAVDADVTDRSGSRVRVAAPRQSRAVRPGSPLFYALFADMENPPASTVALYEFIHPKGRRAYSTDPMWSAAGFKRNPQPICRVWLNPFSSWTHGLGNTAIEGTR